MVRIRDAKIEDLKVIESLLNIEELGWAGEYSMDYFKRLINDENAVFIVAECGREIVAILYAEYRVDEDWAELVGVAVKKDHRRKGIGNRLIEIFEKIIKDKGIKGIEIYAHINTLAKYIEKLGYKKGQTYINCWKKLR